MSNSGWNLVGASLQMISRLRDHIERLDNGVVYADDDLSVVMRALLCPGIGNRVLMRLFNSTAQPMPNILLSKPAPTDPDVFFAVGSIPTAEQGARRDGAVEVSVGRWMTTQVLTVQSSGSRETFTWERFLNAYANKWGGAHLDPAVPAHLRMIDNHAAGGMPLSNYLLRTAAVYVWSIAQQLFRTLFNGVAPESIGSEVKLARVAIPDGLRERVTYVAPGGIGEPPRDISNLGALQAFCHRTGGAELIWYVDESSPDNALHLCLGSLPYDVRYGNDAVPATAGPVEVNAQRQRDGSQPIAVEPGALKQITMVGSIRTLSQVRARVNAPSDVETETTGPDRADV